MENAEKFYESIATKDLVTRKTDNLDNTGTPDIKASDPLGDEVYKQVETKTPPIVQPTQISGSCSARDKLTASDLLPLDANSKWAELNPQCAGDLQDQNYLTAGYHIGINSVGNKRNANLQLRFEPPNPQIPVSPWQISTIEPQTNSHGLLDIGAAPIYK